MYSFFAFAFKVGKSAIIAKTFFFLKNVKMSIKKRRIFMLISNLLMPAFKNVHKKVKSKKPRKNAKNQNTQNSHSFFIVF